MHHFRDRLQEQGAAIISDQVLPAYRRLMRFINQVDMPVKECMKRRVFCVSVSFDCTTSGIENQSRLITFAFSIQEYIPNSRREIGISSLPYGEKYYADVIKWHTDLNISPGDLHNLARQLVSYTKHKIDQVKCGNAEKSPKVCASFSNIWIRPWRFSGSGFTNMLYLSFFVGCVP